MRTARILAAALTLAAILGGMLFGGFSTAANASAPQGGGSPIPTQDTQTKLCQFLADHYADLTYEDIQQLVGGFAHVQEERVRPFTTRCGSKLLFEGGIVLGDSDDPRWVDPFDVQVPGPGAVDTHSGATCTGEYRIIADTIRCLTGEVRDAFRVTYRFWIAEKHMDASPTPTATTPTARCPFTPQGAFERVGGKLDKWTLTGNNVGSIWYTYSDTVAVQLRAPSSTYEELRRRDGTLIEGGSTEVLDYAVYYCAFEGGQLPTPTANPTTKPEPTPTPEPTEQPANSCLDIPGVDIDGKHIIRLVEPVTCTVPQGYVADYIDFQSGEERQNIPAGMKIHTNSATLERQINVYLPLVTR